MDFNVDDYLEVPLKWLETIVDYIPEWPPSWLPDSPPDWLIDLVEKYAPNLPSTYFSDLFHLGLPHFYVQQNVCEKAFDIGVLILTFGTLILIVFLLRRCLSTETSRLRRHWVCYECRAEKSEVLSEDLVHVEKKVETLKNACQNVNKKLQGCLQGQGTDGPALEKRMKKLPQILLSNTMVESSVSLGETSVFGNVLNLCGKVQKLLGNEVLEYEIEVEKSVINKQLEILEVDIPNIVKQRKHLAKLILDMDSAKTRYQTASRHSLQTSGTNAAKADVIKEEMDDASMKVEQCRDLLVSDMFSLMSKESELAHHFVNLVRCQAEYHKKALNILDNYTNCMEEEIRNSHYRPVYGCLLEDHLKINERQIAVPIEICILFLMENGLNEEGLFRVAGSASKMKKLKAAFDANIINIIFETDDFIKDPHAVAGALKSFLRELPNPLMTHELYNEWIHAGRITDTETRLQSLWTIVQKLPVPYFNNLRYLMKFLNKLAANQDSNKMTAQNLAIVIAPNLIWAPEEGSGALGLNMSLANTYSLIVDNLISKADWFFPGDVDFCLPSPVLRSPHDLHQSSPSIGIHSVDVDIYQVNGEMEVHPSLLTGESNNFNYNQQSPQYSGSPKSLRRNKKPAPPAPSALREKPFPVEKPSALKITNSDVKLEKTSVEKSCLERRLSSSSSDKECQPSYTVLTRANNVEKHQQNNSIVVEKPQVPEKPNFEKKISPVDLTRSNVPVVPVPLERHHIEKSQMQTSATEKNQISASHVPEEISLPLGESKNISTVPEIILPSVESESDDDEVNFAPYRPRSPAPVDRFDYYRPEWYGTDQDESEKLNEIIEPKGSENMSEMIFRKKSTILDEKKLKEFDQLIEMTDSLDEVEEVPVNEFSHIISPLSKKASLSEVEEISIYEIGHVIMPPVSKKTSLSDEIEKIPVYEICHVTPPVSKRASLSEMEETSIYKIDHLIPPVSKKPTLSDEVLAVGIPPHSIQFVHPSEQVYEYPIETKETSPKPVSISPDILGNLPFLRRKSPTMSEDIANKIAMSSSDHLDTVLVEKPLQGGQDSSLIGEVSSLKQYDIQDSSFSKEDITCVTDYDTKMKKYSLNKEESPEYVISSSTINDQKISTLPDYDTKDTSFSKEETSLLDFSKEDASNKENEIHRKTIQVHRPSLNLEDDQIFIERISKEKNTPYDSEASKMVASSYSCDCGFDDDYGDHSESYTDSDRWSHSERSVSPDFLASEQLRHKQHSLPIFTEYGLSDPLNESSFEMHNWPSDSGRKGHLVYQRPISPQSSQSVPCTLPVVTSLDVEYGNSHSSLPRKAKPLDTWFSNEEEPIAKPRKSQKASFESSNRPKRPALPPKLSNKPKRPERPPPFVTSADKSNVQEDNKYSSKSHNQDNSEIPLDSSKCIATEKVAEPDEALLEESREDSVERRITSHRIRGSPAAPKRPPRPQPPPPPPPFKPRHNSSSEDTHL